MFDGMMGEWKEKARMTGVWDLKKVLARKKALRTVVLAEILFLLCYSAVVVLGFSEQEQLTCPADDMQLMYDSGETEKGNYTDLSYVDVKAVVTPAFRLHDGIYEIQASFAGRGIVKAGLIYDVSRNGKELFDNEEFFVAPERETFSFRVKIHEDSPVRLKIRLTGDAVDGDYIQLLGVQIVPTKLTCVYRIFLAVALLGLVDLLVLGYFRFYTKWDSRQQIAFLTLLFTFLLTSVPAFQKGLIDGKDVVFHLQRIDGIYQGLLSGQFPVRIQPEWLCGHGYAVSVFYGDIFLYFPALLRMVGFTVEEACKCYLLAVNAATAVIAFYSFRKITRNGLAGMAGAILYLGCPYRLDCLFNIKMGRSGAMMFYPLIVAGFYLLFTEDADSGDYKGSWKYLTFGFTGLLMTHMLSGLMAAAYAALACVVFCRRVCRKKALVEIGKAAGSFILLNLWFLVPFFDYMMREKLKINASLGSGVEEGEDYYALLEDFAQEGKDLFHLLADRDSLGYALVFVIVLFVILMPLRKKEEPLVKHAGWMLAWTLFSVWVCMKSFPVVELAKASELICRYFLLTQYQLRFMSVAVVFAACLGALFFAGFVRGRKEGLLVIGALLCVTVWQCDNYFQTAAAQETFLDAADLNFYEGGNNRDFSVGNGEYLPVGADRSRFTEDVVPQEGVTLTEVEREYLTYRVAAVNTSEKDKEITLPVLYYTGYRARDMQTKTELVTHMGDNGCVAVRVPGNYEGSFEMKFYVAWYWRAAELVSLVSLTAYVICRTGLAERWRKRSREKQTVR